MELQNLTKEQMQALRKTDVSGSLPRPTKIWEAVELLESNTIFELPTIILLKLGLRIMATDNLNFKSSKSLNEGYVICERI